MWAGAQLVDIRQAFSNIPESEENIKSLTALASIISVYPSGEIYSGKYVLDFENIETKIKIEKPALFYVNYHT